MSSIGSRFALQGEALADWNSGGLLPETQVAFKCTTGEGFLLEVYGRAFRERLLAGGTAWVYTAHIVREDAEILFGFETPAERLLFLELRDIDSIGPKTAAQILGGLDAAHFSDLVHGRGLAGVKVPGVGPKTLDKLALGVKSKREKFMVLLAQMKGGATSSGGAHPDRIEDVPFVIVQGLEKLGLRRDEVIRIYRDLSSSANTALDALPHSELIRLVLQRWGQMRSKIQPTAAEGHS